MNVKARSVKFQGQDITFPFLVAKLNNKQHREFWRQALTKFFFSSWGLNTWVVVSCSYDTFFEARDWTIF